MRTGERIAERRLAVGLSQAKLARLVGISQGTIGKLESGISSGSSYLHKIARQLGTTAEYLTGEIDDPAADAPLPLPPAPTPLMMSVNLPPAEALERGFLAVLMASRQMDEAALAHELAVRLPTLLGVLQGPLRIEAAPPAPAEAPPSDHLERQRA